MSRTRDEILANRRRLRTQYGALFDSVAALLFRHDPIGMIFAGDTNTDEYEPEAETILPMLRSCRSADDVHRVVHGEFVRWFGTDTAGPSEHYKAIGSEIWELWQRDLANQPGS